MSGINYSGYCTALGCRIKELIWRLSGGCSSPLCQEGIASCRTPLLNVCITRWVENIDGWERFTLCHPFLAHMCEVILYGDDNFETYNDGWIADDKRNALAYLKILESFEFIYALVTLQWSLMYLKEAVVKLQGEDQDSVSGVLLVEQASDALQALRTDIDAFVAVFYNIVQILLQDQIFLFRCHE